jgi:hypothetical protein
MNYQIEYPNTSNLFFDWENPRLAEFGIKEDTEDAEIFSVLWENMALEEIVISIVAHGFFTTEPLIALRNENIVLEGNRRLAAVRIVLDPDLVDKKLDDEVLQRINPQLISELQTLPVIYVDDRKEAWRFIGFKHINGPTQWNSFAKAQYISRIRKKFDIPLKEIAFQVGDTHKTVQKLYEGIMVIEQAENQKLFSREDIKKGRLYFSHLYTALQYDGFRTFLQISNPELELDNPIPGEKSEELQEFLTWLYGSKKTDIDPIIKAQNPDLRKLESIVKNHEALAAIRANQPLDFAYELSRPRSRIFEDSLYAAQRDVQKAWSYVNEGYKGDEHLLSVSSSLVDRAYDLFDKMKSIRQDIHSMDKKRRREDDAI